MFDMSKKGGTVCVVRGCFSRALDKQVSFFRFPKDEERARIWLSSAKREDLLEKSTTDLYNNYRLCALHFEDRMYANDLKNRLLPSSVPTIFPSTLRVIPKTSSECLEEPGRKVCFISNLHVIDSKPGACYKVHTPDQPHFYPNPRRPEYKDLFESCTEWMKENKNCLALRTQNDEVIVVSCKGVSKRNRPGCYKIVNRDKREEIVCQKLNAKEGCETITTKTGLNVVVHCGARGFAKVKTSKRIA